MERTGEKYRGTESELFSELEKKYSGAQPRPEMTSLTLGGVVDREESVTNSSTGGEQQQQQQRRSTMTLFSIGGGDGGGSADENDDDEVLTETSGRI